MTSEGWRVRALTFNLFGFSLATSTLSLEHEEPRSLNFNILHRRGLLHGQGTRWWHQDFGMDTNPRGKPLCPLPHPPGPDRGNNSASLTFLHSAGLALRRAHCRGCQRCSPHPAPPLLLPESKCCVNVGKGLGGSAGHGNTLPSPPFSHISVLLQQNWGGKGGRGARLGTHAGAGPSGKGQQPRQVWVTSPAALPGSNKNALGCGGVGWGGRRGRGQGRRGSGALTS